MKFVCEFVGGQFNNQTFEVQEAITTCGLNGYSEDLTQLREKGACVHRAELDNQPKFKGYLGPMWNGTITAHGETIGRLRYETQAAYNMLSR